MNLFHLIKAERSLQVSNSLSAGQIALWYALMYINNSLGWKEWFNVANSPLQSLTGMSREGIAKARNVLKQKGYIDFVSKDRQACNYKLIDIAKDIIIAEKDMIECPMQESTPDSTSDSTPNSTPSSTPDSTPDSTTYNTNTIDTKELIKPISSFSDFWAVYPKKKAKPEAEKAWKKLKPDEELFMRMVKAIDIQKKSPDWLKDNGQFIPYPATWLNGKRWDDEVEVMESKPKEKILA